MDATALAVIEEIDLHYAAALQPDVAIAVTGMLTVENGQPLAGKTFCITAGSSAPPPCLPTERARSSSRSRVRATAIAVDP